MKLFGTFCELVQVKYMYQVHLEPIKFISNKIYDFINILLGPVSNRMKMCELLIMKLLPDPFR